ncbi:MAG TPA: adenosine deaminase, partial [Thermoanaerobaculia bacterium]
MVRKLLVIVCFALGAMADEDSTAARLESLREDPLLLRRFLEQMPKGGDLHQHLSGTVYAESYVAWAAKDGLCIDTAALAYAQCNAQSATQVPATQALTDSGLYTKMLDALSMRQYRGDESGHDRFFATFGRFSAATRTRVNDMLAEVVARFARENVDYIESLFGQDLGAARALGRKVEPGMPFAEMRAYLLQNGALDIVAASRKTLDDAG